MQNCMSDYHVTCSALGNNAFRDSRRNEKWVWSFLTKPIVLLVGTNGLEPSTPWMSTKCSNQLSYAPVAGFALYPKGMRASNEKYAQ